MTRFIEKVCAFITREDVRGKELLVFEHEGYPAAGIQIPAGTVEQDEPLEKALLREIREETGLTELRLLNYAGTLHVELPAGEYALEQASEILREPDAGAAPLDLPEGWGTRLNRAWYVTLQEEHANWARVTFQEKDWSASGWVKSELLVTHLVRHLYHLTPREKTAECWNISEEHYTFCLYWLPLQPRPQLEPPQDLWLDQVYERLL